MSDTIIYQEPIADIIHIYSHMLLRIAFTYLKSTTDAEDAVQDVFINLLTHPQEFESKEHEKAWLIRCTINRCKNQLHTYWFKKTEPLDENLSYLPEQESTVLLAMMKLPEKYRAVLHLFYYEGYSIEEIAGLLDMKPATVGTRLKRGRDRLKEILERGLEDE